MDSLFSSIWQSYPLPGPQIPEIQFLHLDPSIICCSLRLLYPRPQLFHCSKCVAASNVLGLILRVIRLHLQIAVFFFLLHEEMILLFLDLVLLLSLALGLTGAGDALEEIADLVVTLLGGVLRDAKGVRDSLVVDLVRYVSARFVLTYKQVSQKGNMRATQREGFARECSCCCFNSGMLPGCLRCSSDRDKSNGALHQLCRQLEPQRQTGAAWPWP